MSEPEKKIPVYGFRKFSMELGRHVRSPSKATVEAIESFQAEAIAGTEEWVHRFDLDGHGRFTPNALKS